MNTVSSPAQRLGHAAQRRIEAGDRILIQSHRHSEGIRLFERLALPTFSILRLHDPFDLLFGGLE